MIDSKKAWVVVWAAFVCLALIFGVSYSFAAFFENFAQEFAANRADVSWIFGLCGLVYFVLGPSCRLHGWDGTNSSWTFRHQLGAIAL
jgi:hypothetical protein